MAAEDAPRRVGLVAVALARDDRVDEEPVHPHHADAAAPLAGRARVVAQLVALRPHREAPFELLDRVVARVRDQAVDGVEPVASRAAAVRALVDLEVDPVLALLLVEARVGEEAEMGRVPGGDLVRDDRRERAEREVDRALHLAEAGEARTRVVGVEDRALRRDHVDRGEHALVLRHEHRVGRLVQEDHPRDERHRRDGGALERAVVARRHLVARAGEIERDLVALDHDRDLDRELDAPRAPVVVEPTDLGLVAAVRHLCDLLPQHLLGVLEPGACDPEHRLLAVAVEKLGVARPRQLAGGDHRLDVAVVEARRADVLEDVLPQACLPDALLLQLYRSVDVSLRPVVDEVDRQPGVGAADVEHVRRGAREADKLALVKDRDHDRHVRRVRGAGVGVVVQDHVARRGCRRRGS